MLKKRWQLGTIWGVAVWFRASSLLLSGLLWLLVSAAALLWLELPVMTAVVVGFTAVILHWLDALTHHLGHAARPQRTYQNQPERQL